MPGESVSPAMSCSPSSPLAPRVDPVEGKAAFALKVVAVCHAERRPIAWLEDLLSATSVLAARIARTLLRPPVADTIGNQDAVNLLMSPLVSAGISMQPLDTEDGEVTPRSTAFASLPPPPVALAEATDRFAEARSSFGRAGESHIANLLRDPSNEYDVDGVLHDTEAKSFMRDLVENEGRAAWLNQSARMQGNHSTAMPGSPPVRMPTDHPSREGEPPQGKLDRLERMCVAVLLWHRGIIDQAMFAAQCDDLNNLPRELKAAWRHAARLRANP